MNMSEPIRRRIGPTRARLERYLEKGEEILPRRLDGTNKDMEQQRIQIDILNNRIKGGCILVETCNCDWMNILQEKLRKPKKSYRILQENLAS